MSSQCTDRFAGRILASWRYDISGIAPEMRGDYEHHFDTCQYCQGRRRLHRFIDIALITLASLSAAAFLLAFGVVYHFGPRHAFWLEVIALFGFAVSAVVWLIVAVATPAPMVVFDAAKEGARRVHDRLPAQVRDRIPEELKLKISGQ